MNTYIIEVHPFPHIMGRDKIVKLSSEKDLDTVLNELKDKLEKENPMFEYDLCGCTVEEFIEGIECIEL